MTPYEVKELVEILITLDATHRDAVLKNGLASALDNRKLD